MNRERGGSSLAMVLMLLVLGSLMLQGLNQAQRRQLAMVSNESLALQRMTKAHSALQWGKRQPWKTQEGQQCLADDNASRICLRLLAGGSLLLIAQNEELRLWQSGFWNVAGIRFSPQGWSDFCPLKEAVLCQIP